MASRFPAEKLSTNDEEQFSPAAKRLRTEREPAASPSPLSVGHERQEDKLKDFDILKVLGEGKMTKVWHARRKQDRVEVAIKQVEKGRKKQKAALKREVRALRQLSGQQFIVGVQHMFEIPTHLYIIMDYASGGDLMGLMERQKLLKRDFMEKDIRFYVSELVLALEAVHNKFIIHKDVKPENVLLDRTGHILLTDFGICQFQDNTDKSAQSWRCGTRDYMAPEVLKPDWMVPGCECARDCYAVGVIALKMVCGESHLPYGDQLENGWAHMRWQEFQDHLLRGMKKDLPNIPARLSCGLYNLLKELLEVDCEKRRGRYGAYQIKTHYFFEDVNWDDVAAKRVAPPFLPENCQPGESVTAPPLR